MEFLNQTSVASAVLSVAILSSLILGLFVLWQNSARITHRLFGLLCVNLGLWAGGVLWIVHTHTQETAGLAIVLTFIVALFLPAAFYLFITYFPHDRFTGNRWVVTFLTLGAIVLAGLTLSPWYIAHLEVGPTSPPLVAYGPVFLGFALLAGTSMAFTFGNLLGKLRSATGIERRQIEHVIAGIFVTTGLASITNIVAPMLGIGTMELYGPCFVLIMVGIFAYSMVRYHLLDIWVLISRTTVYGVVTAVVVLVFMGSVSIVHYLFASGGHARDLLTTALAAGIIVVVLQPVKESTQRFLDRVVLHRGYDAKSLMQRVTRSAAQIVQLDQLMGVLVEEFREALGVGHIRLLMVPDATGGNTSTEYSTHPNDLGQVHSGLDKLIQHCAGNDTPLSLHELRHQRHGRGAELVQHLSELGAFLLVPLRATSGLIGFIAFGEKTSRDIFSQEDIKVLMTVAGPIATSIENASLYRRLEAVNQHLERVLMSMRGGVIVVDRTGHVTMANQEARDLLGVLQLGWTVDTLPNKIAELLRYTLREGRGISDVETVIAARDNELVPIAMSSSAFDGMDNQDLGAMVLIYNMTQIKRLESSVKRADRLTSIGTMAAGMAHEIKNPLQSIKTFSQLLLERFDDPDFRKTFAEIVPPEVQRIDTIVSRLLGFARPRPVAFAPTDVRSIVNDIEALLRNQIRKAGVVLNMDFPEYCPPITGDEQQLHQVFLNLFLNAIDALRNRRERVLTVRVVNERAHLQRKGQTPMLDVPCLKVSISDTGCGIPTPQIDQIFTPFYTTKAEGSGLGLAVVHGIISEHGGEIDVTSAIDVGTTFSLTFPLARVDALERIGA